MHIRHATCHERHGRARTPRVCGAHVVRGGQTGVRTMRSLRVTCAGLALIAVCSVGAAGLTGCSPAQAGGTARGQVSAVASSSSADSASDEAAQSGEATRDEVVAGVRAGLARDRLCRRRSCRRRRPPAPVPDALAADSDDGPISTEGSMAEASTDALPEADGWAPDPVWLSGEGDDARSWSGLVDVSSQSAGSSRAASSQERQYRDGTYYASGYRQVRLGPRDSRHQRRAHHEHRGSAPTRRAASWRSGPSPR